jgi:hypothetical protein
MAKKETKHKDSEARILRAPTYVKYYVTNVKGGTTLQDFRFELMNEKIKAEDDNVIFITDAQIILSPIGAKRLLMLLSASVAEYESKKGEISLESNDEQFV